MSEQVSRIIVPVDGSPTASAAARHASLLARLLEVPLTLGALGCRLRRTT